MLFNEDTSNVNMEKKYVFLGIAIFGLLLGFIIGFSVKNAAKNSRSCESDEIFSKLTKDGDVKFRAQLVSSVEPNRIRDNLRCAHLPSRYQCKFSSNSKFVIMYHYLFMIE